MRVIHYIKLTTCVVFIIKRACLVKVQGIVRSDGWKLLMGQITEAVWTSPTYPNISTNWPDTPHDWCVFV